MEPDNNPARLFWIIWGVEDTEVQYKVAIPTGFSRLVTDVDKQVGFVDAYRSPFYEPHPRYAFWLISNFFPAVNAINNSNLARTPRVWFEGYKYDITEVPGQGKGTAPAPVGSLLQLLMSGKVPSTRVVLGGVAAQSTSSVRLQA